MTGEVIELSRARSKAGRPIEEADDWARRLEERAALRKQRLELLAEERARPTIAPDDPIIALWDAVKEAKATYDAALSELARQRGVPIVNMAAILRSVRQKQKAKARADLHDLPEGVLPI